MRQPGIEPGSIAWKATMLTFTPPTLLHVTKQRKANRKVCYLRSNHRHGVTQRIRQHRRTRYIAFSEINVCFPVRLRVGPKVLPFPGTCYSTRTNSPVLL